MFGRMGVAKGHLNRGVTHQLSDRRLGVSSVAELRAKRMPEVMPTEVGYARNAAGGLNARLISVNCFPVVELTKTYSLLAATLRSASSSSRTS